MRNFGSFYCPRNDVPRRASLEVHRIVDPLVGPEAGYAHHSGVGLADVGQPLAAHMGGMLAPFAIPMPVDDQQHTLLAYSGRWIFKQELQSALVDLGWVPS